MHDRSLQNPLHSRGLRRLRTDGLGAFHWNNLHVLVKKGFEILSQLRDVSPCMLQELTYVLIEGKGIQQMLQAKKRVTSR
jgi:hypothetical protein